MNIYNYIDDYGVYSFDEKEINDVDCVIFSFLSYANFTDILGNNKKKSIKEAGRIHLGMHPSKDRNVIAVKEGNRLLRYLKDTNRFKNCILYNYEYVGDDNVQFGALCIEYKKDRVYVSFEGTDQLFSGWKENFMLGFQFPTLSHKMAISYLKKHFTFSFKKIIVGGHSKGGNLALVAAMYSNFLVQSRISKVYNVDGPGLLRSEFESKHYKNIKKKYFHIIPDYSLVGLLLNHSNDRVVEASNKGILAHNIIYWQVEGSHFKKAKLSGFSKELEKEIRKWFYKYCDEDRKEFVENLDLILKKANVTSILELKEKNSKIIDLIYETKEASPNSKKMILDFINILIKTFGDTKKEEFKNFLSNMFNISN